MSILGLFILLVLAAYITPVNSFFKLRYLTSSFQRTTFTNVRFSSLGISLGFQWNKFFFFQDIFISIKTIMLIILTLQRLLFALQRLLFVIGKCTFNNATFFSLVHVHHFFIFLINEKI